MSKKKKITLICVLILCSSTFFASSKLAKTNTSKLNQQLAIAKIPNSKIAAKNSATKSQSLNNQENDKLIVINTEKVRVTPTPLITSNHHQKNSHQSQTTTNSQNNKKPLIRPKKPSYLPHLQIGGYHSFGSDNFNAGKIDLFLPLWQTPNNLVFSDIRAYSPERSTFEGNIHLGYRYLSLDEKKLYGIYGSFDRRKDDGLFYNQITLGLEYWNNGWFIGGNFYKPIGKTTFLIKQFGEQLTKETVGAYNRFWLRNEGEYLKALSGGDLEIGKELTNRLTGYVGGYYYDSSIYGQQGKLTYDLSFANKFLGIFDNIVLETGIRHDKIRGTSFLIGIKIKIGLGKQQKLSGVARHMVDSIRRDPDIVSKKHQAVISKKAAKISNYPFAYDPNNAPYILAVSNPQEFSKAIRYDQNATIIYVTNKIGAVPTYTIDSTGNKWIAQDINITHNNQNTHHAHSTGKVIDKWQTKINGTGETVIFDEGMTEQIEVDVSPNINSVIKKPSDLNTVNPYTKFNHNLKIKPDTETTLKKHQSINIDLTHETQIKKYQLVNTDLTPETQVKKDQLVNTSLVPETQIKKDQLVNTKLTPEIQIKKDQIVNTKLTPEIQIKKDQIVNTKLTPEIQVKKDQLVNTSLVPETQIKKDQAVNTDLTPEIQIKKDQIVNTKLTPETQVKKDQLVNTSLVPETQIKKDQAVNTDLTPEIQIKKDQIVNTKLTPEIQVKKDQLVNTNLVPETQIKKDLSVNTNLTPEVQLKKHQQKNTELTPETQLKSYANLDDHIDNKTKKLLDPHLATAPKTGKYQELQLEINPNTTVPVRQEIAILINQGEFGKAKDLLDKIAKQQTFQGRQEKTTYELVKQYIDTKRPLRTKIQRNKLSTEEQQNLDTLLEKLGCQKDSNNKYDHKKINISDKKGANNTQDTANKMEEASRKQALPLAASDKIKNPIQAQKVANKMEVENIQV